MKPPGEKGALVPRGNCKKPIWAENAMERGRSRKIPACLPICKGDPESMKRNLVKTLLLIVLLLLAVVLGKALGDVCANVAFLDWLSLSASFGLDPTTLDLAIVKFTFGAKIALNTAQAILLLVAILIYSRIHVKD